MLDFSLVGVLSSITQILAKNDIGIFVISTFNTDYIFVKEHNLNKAIKALEQNNYNIS
ncbi:ACT domain-containing protein [Campylobacter blaseri]|uniref:ACT domain-containing protein n=1 Tax=Campylobacter blaseri TaxID=2042961 RepID=UPI003B9863B6